MGSKMHLDFVHEEVHRAQIRVIGVGGGGGIQLLLVVGGGDGVGKLQAVAMSIGMELGKCPDCVQMVAICGKNERNPIDCRISWPTMTSRVRSPPGSGVS